MPDARSSTREARVKALEARVAKLEAQVELLTQLVGNTARPTFGPGFVPQPPSWPSWNVPMPITCGDIPVAY
mgnify:CR=1 FL=1